jgi:hypothetical protein
MSSFLRDWHFDPISALATLLIGPIAIYILLVARKFLKESAKYIVDGTIYSLNKTFVHRVAASLTLKRYCKLQLAGPSKHMRVPALMPVSLDIDKIFVPLVLENRGVNAAYDNSNLLTAGNRIRIIGDPGSGKSSAAKRLFRDECLRALNRPSSAHVPILLELRTVEIPKNIAAAKLGEWMLTYIRQQCAKLDVYNFDKCFEAYSNRSGLLIILDGLDEVSSESFPRIEAAINGLAVRPTASRRIQYIDNNNENAVSSTNKISI